MQEKRLPTPQAIRGMIQQLKSGVDPDEQETIEELLNGALQRVMAAIPPEALAVLQQLPPQLLESYAVLHQPVEEVQKTVPRQRPAIAPVNRSITIGDMEEDGMTMEITADSPEEQVFVNALAGLSNQGVPLSQVKRGQSLYVPPPVTNMMQLDTFQGAYKGYVDVIEGKGKRAKTTSRIIAVHKAIYEADLAQVGEKVKEPGYWLPRHNAATVYFPGESYEVEVAWLLGDYDPQSSGIPAGLHPTPEQIVQWMHDGIDDEHWEIEVIKRHLRTQPQKVWLEEQDMSISDLLGGRRPHTLDVQWIFDDWNRKLGVKQFGF